ncbi:MAG: gluconokinase [Trueperaceae bacterium]|nr:gluconokinase [Trueperaceae bacterium]
MAQALVIMGVSGSGKSTIGELLSEQLGWPFLDGDKYHPEANVAKMSAGHPLNDDDRRPWLERLHALIREHLDRGASVIIGCSALKESYRKILKGELDNVRFVFLEGSYDLILERMQARQHFMKPKMLKSQFETLEPPQEAITVSIAEPAEQVTERIISKLKTAP